MPRLKTLPPRLREARPRLAPNQPSTVYGQGRGGRPWRRKRDEVLKRDRYQCQCDECQEAQFPRVADEVDHIVPLSQGGTDDPSNLRAIHHDCHKAKTQREARGQG